MAGVPLERRIGMAQFPLYPRDVVLANRDNEPVLGEVIRIYTRNPDPGYTTYFDDPEKFEQFLSLHGQVSITLDDSMWALILFATEQGPTVETIYTYDILERMQKGELTKVESKDFFSNHLAIYSS